VLDFDYLEVPMSVNSSSSIVRFGTFELDLQSVVVVREARPP